MDNISSIHLQSFQLEIPIFYMDDNKVRLHAQSIESEYKFVMCKEVPLTVKCVI